MKPVLFFFLAGIVAVLIQGSVLPYLLTPDWRPDLLLLLVLAAGLLEDLPRALLAALLLGALQDSFCGHSLGLYMSVYLIIVILTFLLAAHLNSDSMPLLLLLIIGGTAVSNLLVAFLLLSLADTAAALQILLPALPQLLLANLLGGSLLLYLLFSYQRLNGWRSGLSHLKRQENNYEE